MGNFMSQGAILLPGQKSDTRPASVPPGAGEWAAADANKIRDALLDLRSAQLGVQTGFVNPNLAVITANGALEGRTLQDRFSDELNAKDWGAVGDGTLHTLAEVYSTLAEAQVDYPHALSLTDSIDWAAIQGCLNLFPTLSWATSGSAHRLVIPQGTYCINRQLEMHGKGSVTIEGLGIVLLRWFGPSTDSIFRANGSYKCVFSNFGFDVAQTYRAYAAMTFGGYLGEHTLHRIEITGSEHDYTNYPTLYGESRLDYGVKLTTPNQNNDHYNFQYCKIRGCRIACVSFLETQSKAHKFYGCFLLGESDEASGYGGMGVECGGSFYWFGGSMTGLDTCFAIKGVSGGEAIVIDSVNVEGSRSFMGRVPWDRWVSGATYTTGYSIVMNSAGQMYSCSTGGVAGATEPTGTGAGISDGGCTWYGYAAGAGVNVTGVSSFHMPYPIEIRNVRFAGQVAPATWEPGTVYSVGNTVTSAVNRHQYICKKAGTSAVAGSGPSTVGYAIQDGSVEWTYNMRFGMPVAGLEELTGGGQILLGSATPTQLDCTQATSKSVGWVSGIWYPMPGLKVSTSHFICTPAGGSGDKPVRLKFWCPYGGADISNCVIMGTNPAIAPVIGFHGIGRNAGEPTINSGPTTPAAYQVRLAGNSIWWGYGGAEYGLPTYQTSYPAYDDRSLFGIGNSYWDLTNWALASGNITWNVDRVPTVLTRTLTADVTSVSVCPPANGKPPPGQPLTLVIQQHASTGPYQIASSAWDTANWELTGGEFVAPPTASGIATISFIYDEMKAKWVETHRSNNSRLTVDGLWRLI